MGISAKVILDSLSPTGTRLTTFEVTLHRFILAEVNTHRALSRNYSSSRAIPVTKQIERILVDPAIPIHFGRNQKGMVAETEVEREARERALAAWLYGRDQAVATARMLLANDIHKQVTNRVLEPYMWATGIITATEWDNFFALRRHPDAQPEFQALANAMWEAMQASKPRELGYTDWHLPYVTDFDEEELIKVYGIEDMKRISAGRCCRVSYKTHDGLRAPDLDVQKCVDLIRDGHMSPLEHQAHPVPPTGPYAEYDRFHHSRFYGNFRDFKQYRKYIPHEANFGEREAS